MESFLIYLFKASALLGIFYLCFLLLLRKETSFQLNRKFLIAGLIFSAILPAIYFTRKVYMEATPANFDFIPASSMAQDIPAELPVNWWQITGILYLVITGVFFLRLCLQIGSVLKIILFNQYRKESGFNFLEVSENQLPFSFFNYIVYNPEKHSAKDLQLILEHEKVHAEQVHSADILLVNFISCILWFNPFAWLYKRAVEQNLEFIADRETVNNTAEIKQYQHALVKVSIADLRPALTNHFYQSFIKKRILMLNKKSSTHSPAWKLSLVMPLLLAFMLLFNVKTEAQMITSEKNNSTGTIKNGKALTISAETSEETLKKLENFFKPDGIILKFMNVKYDSGKIISINSSMTDPVKGNTGTYNQSNRMGIKPFKITVNEDGSMGYETIEDTMVNTMGIQKKFQDIGENPLYIINGKPVQTEDLKGKYLKVNGLIDVRTGVNATALYGSRAKDGSISITDAQILDNFTDDPVFKENTDFSQDYIAIDEDGKPTAMSMKTKINSGKASKPRTIEPGIKVTGSQFSTDDENEIKETLSSEDIIGETVVGYQFVEEPKNNRSGLTQQNGEVVPGEIYIQQAKPLVVLNRVIKDEDYDLKALDPENISHINVIKGTGAIEKYGKKGKDGVIEITTKEFSNNESGTGNVHMHVINKDQSDSSLENLRKMIKTDANIDTEFSNIKRNSKGIITSISVKATTESGKMASASFTNSDGIPTIVIGLNEENKLIVSSSY